METGRLQNLVLSQPSAQLIADERQVEFEELVEQLRFGLKANRILAVEELAGWGADALFPLCETLQDPDDELRIAAAGALGTIGDARAVAPLIALLRSRCAGGSGATHRRTGRVIVWVIFAMLFILPVVLALLSHRPGAMFIGAVGPLAGMVAQRKPRGRLFRAVTRALEQIAEADPTPAVREVLTDLDVLATDSLQQDRETREALRRASRHISSLTEDLSKLPIAAASPEVDVNTLPTPTSHSASDPDVLPRVTI